MWSYIYIDNNYCKYEYIRKQCFITNKLKFLIVFIFKMLPKEELYAPPINIRVKDNRAFGRRPLVGVNSIKSLEHFRCEPLSMEEAEEDRGSVLMGE